MDREIERRLYEAAVTGNVTALSDLLQEDPLLLDRVTLTRFNETPLHIAVMRGHVDFVNEILKQNPQLAGELDSQKSSPLHVASIKGYLEIVNALLEVKPNMCLARDRDGRNPLHLSATKGRVEVLKVLVQESPDAVREQTNNGETILHLCVKHDQLESLKLLVEAFNDHEFVSAKDDDGNTILHLAVSGKQIETIKYLLMSTGIELNEQNAKGETALDILAQSQRDVINLDIGDTLREAGGVRATQDQVAKSNNGRNNSMTNFIRGNSKQKPTGDHEDNWLEKQRQAIMVVASLIATMTFQAGMNPPGGPLQDAGTNDDGFTVAAGESVLASRDSLTYLLFLRANTIAFVSSLSTILLLISGFSLRRKLVMWVLLVTMWLTIITVGLTYLFSVDAVSPSYLDDVVYPIANISLYVFCGVMGLLFIGNTIRLMARSVRLARNGGLIMMAKSLKEKGINIWRLRKSGQLIHATHGDNSQESTLQIQLS